MATGKNESRKQGFPLRLFAAAVVISILTTVFTGWQLWEAHNRFEEMSRKHIALTEGIGRIMLLDEAQAMSERLAAATGDFSYEKRYNQLDPQLTKAINDVRAVLPQPEIERFVRETDEANHALDEMERQAFALTHQGTLSSTIPTKTAPTTRRRTAPCMLPTPRPPIATSRTRYSGVRTAAVFLWSIPVRRSSRTGRSWALR